MSVEATIWAWSIRKNQISSLEKLVLLSLADRADEDFECWPSAKRLEDDCNTDIKTIYKALESLCSKGIIEKTGKMKGKTKSIPVYKLIGAQKRESTSTPENGIASSEALPKTGELSTPENGSLNLYNNNKNNNVDLVKKASMELSDILDCNPFEISKTSLSDWLAIVKFKGSIVTVTSWNRLCEQLSECESRKISPKEAFDIMVSNNWLSLNADMLRVKNKKQKSSQAKNSKSTYDHKSTDWIKDIHKEMF